MGAAHWATMLAAGLIGIFYLAVGLVPLATGRIELDATEVDIAVIERDGFPEAEYLRVTGGVVVFPEADVWLRETPDDDGRRLIKLTAPVVSHDVATAWNEAMKAGKPLDLSRMRLAVSFSAATVAERWPAMRALAESGKLSTLRAAVTLPVIGETVPFDHLLAQPVQSRRLPNTFVKEAARGMRFETHHHSLGNVLGDVLWGIGWLGLCGLLIWVFRRRPPRPAMTGPEVEMAAQGFGELLDSSDGDPDVGFDVD